MQIKVLDKETAKFVNPDFYDLYIGLDGKVYELFTRHISDEFGSLIDKVDVSERYEIFINWDYRDSQDNKVLN